MSKFQIVKGIIDNLANAPYVEGKVYFVYNNATSTNLSIYADIDGTRKKIYDPSVDGLDAIESQLDELYVREDEFASRVNYELDPLDGSVKLREPIAADETTKTLYENFTSSSNQIKVITPNEFASSYMLLYFVLILQHRINLMWMNNSEIESSTLQIKINTQTKDMILYAKGKSSIAYGIAGVDSEWIIEALPSIPPATVSTLGGVKVGNGLSVESDGTLSSNLDYAASPMSGGNAVRANGILYATVDSTSTSTNFTATVNGLTELYDGACVMLHNGVVTSAKGFTVNINGLGAKKCYSNMTNATQETTIFNVNYTLMFVYSTTLDSGNGGWWIYRGYDANTTYTPVKLGFGYGHCTTDAATAAKTVTISNYVLNTGGIVSVLFDHNVQAGATLNVTSKGAKAIYHRGAAIKNGIIKAGDTATFMYSGQYHLVSIDRDYVSYTLPPATSSTLGGVTVGDGLSVTAEGQLSVTDYYDFVKYSGLKGALDDTLRFTVVTTDATSESIVGNAFGETFGQIIMPNGFTNKYQLFLAINNRFYLAWMNGTKMELAPLNCEVDVQTQATTLYARGRSSMAYGVAGVDESWTIEALPEDAEGRTY